MKQLLHLMRECSFVSPFWKQVIKSLGGWLYKPLPKSPQLCLLEERSLLPRSVPKQEFGLALAGFSGTSKDRSLQLDVRQSLTFLVKLPGDIYYESINLYKD